MNDGPPPPPRQPLSVARIVDVALAVVEAEGYDHLTMRKVSAALGATPGALYAHVRDKAELDDLMLGEVCSGIEIAAPDSARWREQARDVLVQLRDAYLRYPGISRVALERAPHSLETLAINEGLLRILVAGGATVRQAAWTIDSALQYVAAYSVVSRRRTTTGEERGTGDRDEVVERLSMLPPARFELTVTYAAEITSGSGHERFDFSLDRILGAEVSRPAQRQSAKRSE